MRYFTTEAYGYMFWRYDGHKLEYTADDPRVDDEPVWMIDHPRVHPDEINTWARGTYKPGDAFYAYETDEDWNRL